MHHPRACALVAILLFTTAYFTPPAHAEGSEEGFTAIFNGKDLTGWDADPAFWSVRDGAITAESTEANPCKRNTFAIWTGGEVRDFELRLKVRIVGGNSGIQYRSQRGEGWSVAGYQADFEAGPKFTGILYDEGGRGILANRGEKIVIDEQGKRTVTGRTGEAQTLNDIFKVGEWNDYTVIAMGNHLVHKINGQVMIECADHQEGHFDPAGILALQLHAGPPMLVQFKDIRIHHFNGGNNAAAAAPPPAAVPQTQGVVDLKERSEPEWIWLNDAPAENQTVYFRREFTLHDEVLGAMLTGSCDNSMEVFLNGKLVAQGVDWTQPIGVNVTKSLRQGRNVLAVVGRNEGSAAGLVMTLTMTKKDRSRIGVLSDATWVATAEAPRAFAQLDFQAQDWSAAHSFGKLGIAPWGELPRGKGGAAGTATAAESLKLPPGFKAELLYSVPRSMQGSWVSLAVDPKNRFYVSDQGGRMYRVTVGATADDTEVEPLALDIGGAQGLLWAHDSLYVMVNGGPKSGMWRLRDTDGDDQLDDMKQLLKLKGAGEHGPHAIVQGPDNLLYIIAGNHTPLPEHLAADSAHRNWDEDLLLPRSPDGNGHANGVMAPGGWVVATDADGTFWRLIGAGLRNAYDIGFNKDGELFTFDSDMEWDTGTAWYRPTRVNHFVSGAEFGWRHGTGKWPAYYPDSVGAVVDVGLGSPTGVTFGYGAKFPARYQEAFFILDWSYGKIYAVHLEPDGATYRGRFEVFVEGKPLPLTDAVIGRDGALYFTIGGRNTQSGLYRVTYAGEASTAPIALKSQPSKPRDLRRRLEAFHGKVDSAAVEFAWPHLNSSDRAIRYAARVAIEHQPVETWAERALAETHVNASIQALLALARNGDASQQAALFASLDRLPLASLTEEQTLDALRVYGLACIRMGRPDDKSRATLISKFDALLPSRSESINRELTALLIYLEAPSIAGKAMKLLADSRTQEEYIYYLFVLRTLRTGWTPEMREAYFRWINLATTKFHGGNSFANFLRNMKNDAVATLTEDESKALEQIINDPVQVASVDIGPPRQFVHNWQMDDLLPLLEQTARDRDFERGKAAFTAASCIQCHRFAGEGGNTGQDLTGVGNRFSARDLLESIVEPSRVISDQYADTEFRTRDGDFIVGRIEKEEGDVVLVRTHPLVDDLVEINVDTIESRQLSKVSKMPNGVINVLTKEEVLDLIAYLRSGGNRDDPAFK